jgi:hypothetical protein
MLTEGPSAGLRSVAVRAWSLQGSLAAVVVSARGRRRETRRTTAGIAAQVSVSWACPRHRMRASSPTSAPRFATPDRPRADPHSVDGERLPWRDL